MNITLVEDNLALNEVLKELLSSQGYCVSGYRSAEEVTIASSIDVAVLDLNLPGEDGLSLAARLKAYTPTIGIVLLTIRNSLDDKLKGYEHGADVYLPKPVDPSELLAVVNSLSKRLNLSVNQQLEKNTARTALTEKEIDVVSCLSKGMSYNQIAAVLGVSLSTVQSHTRSLYLKLDVHSKNEAVFVAQRDRYIT